MDSKSLTINLEGNNLNFTLDDEQINNYEQNYIGPTSSIICQHWANVTDYIGPMLAKR